MDNAQRIKEWNARWIIVAGQAVCTGCLESQALGDCDRQFSHAHTCEVSNDQSKYPWIALHDILDCARG